MEELVCRTVQTFCFLVSQALSGLSHYWLFHHRLIVIHCTVSQELRIKATKAKAGC
jgi:hypothetical protein